ncbi:LTA synthase family protein [Clostridium sp. PL3]|uniref:LTA synthase family protein n=1 Tax=Clostridium thailandense TaxID=2794346 RepID=A0A949TX20_9CLOT|nr:LTA synthase family protein [Clostridium thailandense]MBV7274103.1 LTA synthase family protein [Clostridium thailandense]
MRNRTKLIFLNNVDIIIFFILVTAKLFHYAKIISPYTIQYNLKLAIIASILPIISIAFILTKRRLVFLYIADLILSSLLVVDMIYFKYYKDIISIRAISNSVLLSGVTASVEQLIMPSDFIYLVDVAILFPLIIFRKRIQIKHYSSNVRISLFALVVAIGIIIDGLSISSLNKQQPLLLTTMSNKLYIANSLGVLNYHMLDLYNFSSTSIKNTKISTQRIEEIKAFLNKEHIKVSENLSGEGLGKNLIVIQVEALQQFVINSEVNGNIITPNLNRWINKSLYFDNYFYQVAAGTTSDAEFMSMNSLYPAESGAAYYVYVGDTLESSPKLFNNKGYYTAAMHGYAEGFWNRESMYKTEGFKNFYGEHSYNINETVGLGLSDKSFLNQSIEKIKTFKQPYYTFLITLSSHFPFNDTKGYGNFDVGKYENTLLGDYLKGIHYTDEQLGNFLDKLEQEGIMKNSIVVVYGDHYAIPNTDVSQLYEFENVTEQTDLTWYMYQKVPMFIHFPNDNHKGVNHTYSGQMDLLPTLANMFNLPIKYTFGKDIMNTNTQYILFREGSFTDGKVFYISWTNTYYDIATGKTIAETSELKMKKEEILNDLSYSDDILNHNLIKKFEGSK